MTSRTDWVVPVPEARLSWPRGRRSPTPAMILLTHDIVDIIAHDIIAHDIVDT